YGIFASGEKQAWADPKEDEENEWKTAEDKSKSYGAISETNFVENPLFND
ncbi:hypothetical protein BpHYR1_023399, partial [Brachionus plicatilis]